MQQIGNLSIHFRGHGDELVAKPEIHGQVRPQPNVILHEESEQSLAIAAHRVNAARQGKIELTRNTLQEIRNVRKGEKPAYLAGGVLIELDSLHIKTHLDAVGSAAEKNSVAKLPVVQAIQSGQAVVAEVFGSHARDGQISERLACDPGKRRRNIEGPLVYRFVVRAVEAEPQGVQ